jgi:hypothetical protein
VEPVQRINRARSMALHNRRPSSVMVFRAASCLTSALSWPQATVRGCLDVDETEHTMSAQSNWSFAAALSHRDRHVESEGPASA